MVKKLTAMILTIALISLFTFSTAEAGEARYRWQGAAIALGAVALGGLILHHAYAHAYPPPVVYAPLPPPGPPPEFVPGHWEIVREWVPGISERVWVPGHYDRWGNWVTGHYVIRQSPGRYVDRRVWVEGYYRDNDR